MALNNLGLGFLFTAKDMASGTIRKLSGNFNQLGGQSGKAGMMGSKAMVGLGAATAVAGAGIAGLAVGFAAANRFGEFEQGIANVGATMGATEEQMEKLSKAAIQAGIDTQFSPVEATKGLDALAAAGQNTEQSIASLAGVLDLAAGSKGQLGLAESAEAVVGTLNSYGMSADDAGTVTDKLLLATQKSNFQARDFAAGLAKAAAAGGQFDQELETVLATMGFLRNANIDASSSATAFREATRRLGSDQRAQQALQQKGIEIFDKQTNKMRQLPDIMADLAEQTKDMDVEERNRIVTQAFGARGMLAFNAIQKATFTVMRDGKKVTLQGKEAFKAFTDQLKDAGGTAEKTRERLLDTFEGQKTLLKGTLETLAITGGEAFAEIFRPIVSAVTNFLNMIIKAIVATPKPIKKLIGGLFLGLSAFIAVAGGAGMVAAAIALLAPFLKIIAIAMGVAALAMIPVIIGFGLLALAVIGFRQAFDKNIGGIADSAGNFFGKIKLAFMALYQFFSEGKISGAVAEDLSKAENQGVLNFVNRVVQIVQRVVNFFKGISTGFSEAIEGMGPTFEKLSAAFSKLGKALGFLGAESGTDQAKEKFEEYGAAGERVGATLAWIFEGIVIAITTVVDFIADLVEAFGEADTELTGFNAVSDSVGESLGLIGDALGITGDEADGASDRVSTLKSIIEGIVFIVDAVATAAAIGFSLMATTIADTINAVKTDFQIFMGGLDVLRAAFALLTGDTEKAWALLKRGIYRAISGILGKIAYFVSKLARAQKAIGIEIPGIDLQALKKTLNSARDELNDKIDAETKIIDKRTKAEKRPLAVRAAQAAGVVPVGARGTPLGAAPAERPAVAAAGLAARGRDQGAAVVSAIRRIRVRSPNVNVKVLLDGEELSSKLSKSTDESPGGQGTGD